MVSCILYGDDELSEDSIIYPDGKPSECTESLIEAVDGNKDRFIYEAADLLYHYLVLLEQMGVGIADIEEELLARHR